MTSNKSNSAVSRLEAFGVPLLTNAERLKFHEEIKVIRS